MDFFLIFRLSPVKNEVPLPTVIVCFDDDCFTDFRCFFFVSFAATSKRNIQRTIIRVRKALMVDTISMVEIYVRSVKENDLREPKKKFSLVPFCFCARPGFDWDFYFQPPLEERAED